MTIGRTRLELLQWFALFGGPLAWTVQHVVGYGIADAGCSAVGTQWDFHTAALQIALSTATGVVVLAAEAAAFVVFRQTRDVDQYAPGPNGRIRFLAQAALLGNVLFFVIVVLDGVGTVYHLPCHQA
jgi:hypothetical protein